MQKPKKINWKETNVAGIGSDLDKKIRAAAASGEAQWRHVGEKVEVRVWRIEQFRVVPWPARQYGSFHAGDSYVVLRTFRPDPKSDRLAHDVHIWIGDESTADEYGTAAYKMVELDDLLGGAAKQHRETQGRESAGFAALFCGQLRVLRGGVESGFRHVEASAAAPLLYRVKGTRHALELRQVDLRRDSLNSGDCFVLHAGDGSVWQWNGSASNKDERLKAGEVARDLAPKAKLVIVDEAAPESAAPEFWAFLPGTVKVLGILTKSVEVRDADDKDGAVKAFVPKLYRVTPSGFRHVADAATVPLPVGEGLRIARSALAADAATYLDTGFHLYVYIGADARAESARAITATAAYEKKHRRPALPVSVVKHGQHDAGFEGHFYDPPPDESCCVVM